MGSWTISHYQGSLSMPHIEQVDKYTEYRVYRGGKYVPCSNAEIAENNAAFYRQQGYTDVRIELRQVPIIGEVLP